MSEKTLSVVIPAYNEEKNIEDAVASVVALVTGRVREFEIIVIDDHSSDQTAQAIKGLAGRYPFVKPVFNTQNQGLGYNLKTGFYLARFDYMTWFPGDNSAFYESLVPAVEAIGTSDIIITYMANVNERTRLRKNLSVSYTFLLNLLFGLHVRYYNGLSIYSSRLIKSLKIHARGHDCLGEILVRLLRSGQKYIERPFTHRTETETKSKAVSLKNLTRIFQTLCILIRDIYFQRRPMG